MTDLVKKLRDEAAGWQREASAHGRTNGVERLLKEAADEIERLLGVIKGSRTA